MWDHTVLPATDTSERAPPNPSHAAGTRFTYRVRQKK